MTSCKLPPNSARPTPGGQTPLRPVLGCLAPVLALFIAVFGCAGVFAFRMDMAELPGQIVIDILVGLAVAALAAIGVVLNSPSGTRRRHKLFGAMALGLLCGGGLIAWHSYAAWMREKRLRIMQQRIEAYEAEGTADR